MRSKHKNEKDMYNLLNPNNYKKWDLDVLLSSSGLISIANMSYEDLNLQLYRKKYICQLLLRYTYLSI